jgi:hypothetical protein
MQEERGKKPWASAKMQLTGILPLNTNSPRFKVIKYTYLAVHYQAQVAIVLSLKTSAKRSSVHVSKSGTPML